MRSVVQCPKAKSQGPEPEFSRFVWVWLLVWLCGCASCPPASPAHARHFDFQKDTFAFPNQLVWEYHYDAAGHWKTERREPKPTYALHCFVLARSAVQFLEHARFDPNQPIADQATYRRLIRLVVSTNLRHPVPDSERIVIPGYADLRSFSQAQEAILKAELGSACQSYFQRGNWRMIFPFSRHGQQSEVEQLLKRLKADQPLIVHLVRFPQLTINHAVVIFGARETEDGIQFQIYDPNQPAEAGTLFYQRAARTFQLPANNYFPGGRVDVYQIYWKWDY